jgi:hypothetical protein
VGILFVAATTIFSFIIGLALSFDLILLSPSYHPITVFELLVLTEFRPNCLFYRRAESVTIRNSIGLYDFIGLFIYGYLCRLYCVGELVFKCEEEFDILVNVSDSQGQEYYQ